ncbi:pentapeptide repeat-containing protein [Cellulomonas sp. PSBB021]|uniref:pentapeptide repeat-containing protein n=1 Tax=Cellulomonas sp. PSBB021 TaxID=2003551 RepID=UPI000B8D92A0|nr:pentapeptide repeat-containing protein [Cellulomonas sp. PSBB021]ASR54073.1 hypothetical protein CBP52_01710 [Cellulomonas sp. PSBB021]
MVDVTDADLRGSTFDRVDLSGARLRRSNLDGITVRGADMQILAEWQHRLYAERELSALVAPTR